MHKTIEEPPETELPPLLKKPISYFHKYVSTDLLKIAASATNKYAVLNNFNSWEPTTYKEIQVFLGIQFLMSIYVLPRIEMYWKSHANFKIITDNMTLKRFFQIRSAIHFTTKENENPDDRFWKVRPLFESIRKYCLTLKTGMYLSIDEQMIPYRGDLNIKQYIKNKPTKWGVKLFALCGSDGILHDFILQGHSTELKKEYLEFGQGAAVVMQLVERINTPKTEIYFDNYFSTFHLFEWLKTRNLRGIGTIRINRFFNPPFTTNKEIKKKSKKRIFRKRSL